MLGDDLATRGSHFTFQMLEKESTLPSKLIMHGDVRSYPILRFPIVLNLASYTQAPLEC